MCKMKNSPDGKKEKEKKKEKKKKKEEEQKQPAWDVQKNLPKEK